MFGLWVEFHDTGFGNTKIFKIFKIVEISVMVQKFLPYIKSEKKSFFRFFPIFGLDYFGLWVVWVEIPAGMETP